MGMVRMINLAIVNFIVFEVYLCKIKLKDVQKTYSQRNLK